MDLQGFWYVLKFPKRYRQLGAWILNALPTFMLNVKLKKGITSEVPTVITGHRVAFRVQRRGIEHKY
jgi:hypothetical protein